MKMKPCKSCGHMIASNASSCPNCGHKYSKTSSCFSYGIIIIVVLFMIGYIISSFTNKGTVEKHLKTTTDVIEVRVTPKEGINIRTGPGTEFPIDESGQLVKGEKLYVVEEKNNWIRFRVTQNDLGWSGWVKKDLTIPDKKLETSLSDGIKLLQENGLLKKINPQLNEAFVDPIVWDALDIDTKESASKIMAFYCGNEKGTKLNWVDIKDYYSGKKIAKYSENWGFEVF